MIDRLIVVADSENDDASAAEKLQARKVASVGVVVLVDDEELELSVVEIGMTSEACVEKVAKFTKV